jgi:hypothetical protein
MPRDPNGHRPVTSSITASLASYSGSVDSFHVEVCWKMIPCRCSSSRSASRPMRTGRRAGKNGTLFPHYPTMTSSVHAGSDHAAIYADVELD